MNHPRAYYISQGQSPQEHLHFLQKMVDSGADTVQLRLKKISKEELFDIAYQVQKYCRERGCRFIVNDSVEIARAVDADGVHLGKEDTDPLHARNVLGFSKIIGGTANTLEDCLSLIEKKVNYIGLGPLRFTTTKKKLSPTLGINGYIDILSQLGDKRNLVPVIAIGGILCEDFIPLKEARVKGIALSGLLHREKNPKHIIQKIHSLF